VLNNENGLINNIQFLRAVSAILVIFFHLAPIYVALKIPQFGGGGVDIFFVISGFIMARTRQMNSMSAASFLSNRIKRIVPLYWIVTLFVFGLSTFSPGLMKSPHTSISELVQSLLFIPFSKDGAITGPVLFLGWTLNYEMMFYLIFSVSFLYPKKIGLNFAILCIFFLVSVGQFSSPIMPIAKFYTDPIMLEFCYGIIIAISYDLIPYHASIHSKALVFLLSLTSLLMVILMPVLWRDIARPLLSGIPAAMLVSCVLILEKWNLCIRSASALLLGSASYSIYLLHIFVAELAIKTFYKVQLNAVENLIFLIFWFVAAIGFGIFAFVKIEKPISVIMRKMKFHKFDWVQIAKSKISI
jgi:exopolysaccharide production protein ExoZ